MKFRFGYEGRREVGAGDAQAREVADDGERERPAVEEPLGLGVDLVAA